MVLIGNEACYPAYTPKTQVYTATHKFPTSHTMTSWDYKSYMDRSFISFSFGGKRIEDYNLLATIQNNRLQKQGSASFENLTSDSKVMDGQIYWGTHFTENNLNLLLATDGITENQLGDFQHWFAPGQTRELILSEHPNRAIMARISTATILNLLPFEEKTTLMINETAYETSTTLYKGEIQLQFMMDEPFWYAKEQFLGNLSSETKLILSEKSYPYLIGYAKINQEPSNEEVTITPIKIQSPPNQDGSYHEEWYPVGRLYNTIYGDKDGGEKVEIISKTEDSWFDSQGRLTEVLEDKDAIKIIKEDGLLTSEMMNPDFYIGNSIIEIDAQVGLAKTGESVLGPGPILASKDERSLSPNETIYLYYPGTAPTKPIIKMTITPELDSSGYIINPKNSYVETDCNTITFQSVSTKYLKYSLPGAYVGYNEAIKIFLTSVEKNLTLLEIRELIRSSVSHKHARAWAIAVVDRLASNVSIIFDSTLLETALQEMKYFLCELNSDEALLPSFITINSKEGRTIGKIGYRKIDSFSTEASLKGVGIVSNTEEDVGDMLRSEYLQLDDKNYLNDKSQLEKWSELNPSASYKVTHDSNNGYKNFMVTYDYMYY